MNTQRYSRRLSGYCYLLVAAGLVAVLAGCGPSIEDMRTEGIQQFRNRQYIESMATLNHVLERSPNDAVANYYMGLNYRTLAARKFRDNDVPAAYRDLDTAILYFTQSVKSWPNYLEAVASKNEALEARGKYAQALALAEHVAHTNRGEAAEHFVFLGDEYRERGDFDNAVRAYKIALSSNPSIAQAYVGLGKVYQRTGDLELARDAYRRAYELNPTDANVAEVLAELETMPDVRTAAHQPRADGR